MGGRGEHTGRNGQDERWRQPPRGRERDAACVRRCRFLRADRTGAVSSLGLLSPPRPVPSGPVPCIGPIFVGLVAAGVVSPDCMPQQTRKPQATSSTCTSINALRTEAAVGGSKDQSLTRVRSNVLMLIRSIKHKLTA
jgi:hypothetical protein